jgi:hypothetical protein
MEKGDFFEGKFEFVKSFFSLYLVSIFITTKGPFLRKVKISKYSIISIYYQINKYTIT